MTTILSLLTTSGVSEHTKDPLTSHMCGLKLILLEISTVCVEAPQGEALLKK